MKPLITYYGGKQRIATRIVQYLPPHLVYVEPFAGGLAVLFRKGKPHTTNQLQYKEVVNDISGDLVNLYQCLTNKKTRILLIEKLQGTPYSREVHSRAKEILSRTSEDPVDRGWAYFVCINTSFNADLNGGWHPSVTNRNCAATWTNAVAELREKSSRLRGVTFENLDALKVIDRWDSPETCFYLDPPYPGACQGHYSGYTQEDFERLVSKVSSCKGSFVLSCYANAAVPKSWDHIEIPAFASSSPIGKTIRGGRGKVNLDDPGPDSRRRVEMIYWVDRSETIRANQQKALIKVQSQRSHDGSFPPRKPRKVKKRPPKPGPDLIQDLFGIAESVTPITTVVQPSRKETTATPRLCTKGDGPMKTNQTKKRNRDVRADEKKIKAALAVIKKHEKATLDGALRVGKHLLKEFFGGNIEAFRSKSGKDPSFRALCKRPELVMHGVSQSTLRNYIRVYATDADYPKNLRGKLGLATRIELLRVADSATTGVDEIHLHR